MPIRSFQQLEYEATWLGPKTVAIASAASAEVLDAAREAQSAGMARCILVGQRDQIARTADLADTDISDMQIVPVESDQQSARMVMEMARSGEADVVMKGTLGTPLFISAALDREAGLRRGKLFTHVAVYEIPGFRRLLLISDGGVVIAPDIYQKVEIVQNAIDVGHTLGIETPRVAILAAAELVNPKIPSTVDAASLSKMAERGQIVGGIVDGPLALDNAISPEAADIKGIRSPVAGRADILIVPDIEAGNIMAKAISYFAHGSMAGIVVGGLAPMVVTSRSDPPRSKLVSMALAILVAAGGYRQVDVDETTGARP